MFRNLKALLLVMIPSSGAAFQISGTADSLPRLGIKELENLTTYKTILSKYHFFNEKSLKEVMYEFGSTLEGAELFTKIYVNTWLINLLDEMNDVKSEAIQGAIWKNQLNRYAEIVQRSLDIAFDSKTIQNGELVCDKWEKTSNSGKSDKKDEKQIKDKGEREKEIKKSFCLFLKNSFTTWSEYKNPTLIEQVSWKYQNSDGKPGLMTKYIGKMNNETLETERADYFFPNLDEKLSKTSLLTKDFQALSKTEGLTGQEQLFLFSDFWNDDFTPQYKMAVSMLMDPSEHQHHTCTDGTSCCPSSDNTKSMCCSSTNSSSECKNNEHHHSCLIRMIKKPSEEKQDTKNDGNILDLFKTGCLKTSENTVVETSDSSDSSDSSSKNSSPKDTVKGSASTFFDHSHDAVLLCECDSDASTDCSSDKPTKVLYKDKHGVHMLSYPVKKTGDSEEEGKLGSFLLNNWGKEYAQRNWVKEFKQFIKNNFLLLVTRQIVSEGSPTPPSLPVSNFLIAFAEIQDLELRTPWRRFKKSMIQPFVERLQHKPSVFATTGVSGRSVQLGNSSNLPFSFPDPSSYEIKRDRRKRETLFDALNHYSHELFAGDNVSASLNGEESDVWLFMSSPKEDQIIDGPKLAEKRIMNEFLDTAIPNQLSEFLLVDYLKDKVAKYHSQYLLNFDGSQTEKKEKDSSSESLENSNIKWWYSALKPQMRKLASLPVRWFHQDHDGQSGVTGASEKYLDENDAFGLLKNMYLREQLDSYWSGYGEGEEFQKMIKKLATFDWLVKDNYKNYRTKLQKDAISTDYAAFSFSAKKDEKSFNKEKETTIDDFRVVKNPSNYENSPILKANPLSHQCLSGDLKDETGVSNAEQEKASVKTTGFEWDNTVDPSENYSFVLLPKKNEEDTKKDTQYQLTRGFEGLRDANSMSSAKGSEEKIFFALKKKLLIQRILNTRNEMFLDETIEKYSRFFEDKLSSLVSSKTCSSSLDDRKKILAGLFVNKNITCNEIKEGNETIDNKTGPLFLSDKDFIFALYELDVSGDNWFESLKKSVGEYVLQSDAMEKASSWRIQDEAIQDIFAKEVKLLFGDRRLGFSMQKWMS